VLVRAVHVPVRFAAVDVEHDALAVRVGALKPPPAQPFFDSAGAFKGGYSYSPYGEARATGTNAAVTGNPLRYIGEHHDGNGIYKLGARYYDTTLGRFTQTDPSGQEANPYAYAACNSVNYSDPSGHLYEDGWNYGQSAAVGLASGIASAAVGCVTTGLIGGVPTAGAGFGPGCVVGGSVGFISGALSGFAGDAVSQAF
jgi:RHS repeat-associated protein